MTAAETVDRFMKAITTHPDTAVMGAMVSPYRAMAGNSEDIVRTLDLLAGMWAEAKNGGSA